MESIQHFPVNIFQNRNRENITLGPDYVLLIPNESFCRFWTITYCRPKTRMSEIHFRSSYAKAGWKWHTSSKLLLIDVLDASQVAFSRQLHWTSKTASTVLLIFTSSLSEWKRTNSIVNNGLISWLLITQNGFFFDTQKLSMTLGINVARDFLEQTNFKELWILLLKM